MRADEIAFVQALDKHCLSGTIQGMLIGEDLVAADFVKVLKFLVKQFKQERDALEAQNLKLSNLLGEALADPESKGDINYAL